MRHVTETGIALIKHFESFSAAPYVCPAGYPTGGWGHVFLPGEEPRTLSEDEAELILRRDCLNAERSVLRLIRVPLEDGRFDSLVSFVFNLGGGNLQRSTLRMKVNRGEHDAVPAEFRRWVYAGGRVMRGLVRRREAEAALYCGMALQFGDA
jgi:GH24 family phage-related lysozyme (muramidase)